MGAKPVDSSPKHEQMLERRYQRLIDSVTDYAIYMLDPDGIITTWNTGAELAKGYKAEEIIGQHFSRFFTDEDRAQGVPQMALEAARRNGRYESEGWRVRRNGSRLWVSAILEAVRDDDGALVGFAKVTRDMTDRMEAARALQESERQFRLLISGVVDCALYMIDPNGIVTNWNPGAERIKGYKADEIVGQHFSRFYTLEDRRKGIPMQAILTATRDGKYEAEGLRVRKDGTEFWAHVVIDAIRDEKGELVGFAKITRDITERLAAQAELERVQIRMAQSQKMEAIGQLTGGVAHDFNNLLMIVSGHIQGIKRRHDDDRTKQSAAAIEAAVARGANLTRQLLAFSRHQPLAHVAIDLGKRMPDLRQMLSSAVGGACEVSIFVLPGTWPLLADPSELDFALLNLAVNARDAMPEGGRITVTAENIPSLAPNAPPGTSGDLVAITVADQGTGIPAEVLDKVFDPFFTTKEPGKGSGLGLSQVYGFCSQSGGAVQIHSEPGRGTRVTMFLKRSMAEAQDAPDSVAAPAGVGGHVLVVEDNPEVANVTSVLLEQVGYHSTVVHDAASALERIEKGETFDLVFSDIIMPGKTGGLELARILRKRYPDLPVLLATGYSSAAEGVEPEFRILRKPYIVTDLQRAITEAVGLAGKSAPR
jgi:PAS domain S-box-containing protein